MIYISFKNHSQFYSDLSGGFLSDGSDKFAKPMGQIRNDLRTANSLRNIFSRCHEGTTLAAVFFYCAIRHPMEPEIQKISSRMVLMFWMPSGVLRVTLHPTTNTLNFRYFDEVSSSSKWYLLIRRSSSLGATRKG